MRAIGTVVEEESGRPIAGLRVRAFDKDILFDDKLGVAITRHGVRIDYSQLDFSSVFGTETSPELYIRIYGVTDKKLLFPSESRFARTANRRTVRHQDSPGQTALPTSEEPRHRAVLSEDSGLPSLSPLARGTC
jgi:hypothetical protein